MTRIINFNDGEAILHTDFNTMNDLLLGALGDVPLYNRAHGLLSLMGDSGLPATNWLNASLVEGRCWTIGSHSLGLRPQGGTMDVIIAPGVAGIYQQSPSGPPDGSGYEFVFGHSESNVTMTHTDGTAVVTGRVDLVTMGLTETVGSSESRDFEDAVTGALSTQSVNKRRTFSLDFQITEGSDGGGYPAVPAGRVPVYSIEVQPGQTTMSAFVEDLGQASRVREHTFPLGRLRTETILAKDFVPDSSWLGWLNGTTYENGELNTAVNGAVCFCVPRGLSGAQASRLIRVDIGGAFGSAPGVDAYLAQTSILAISTTQSLVAASVRRQVGTALTGSGTSPGDIEYVTPLSEPVWGSGCSFRHGTSGDDRQLVLQIQNADANNRILRFVRFFYIEP